MGGLLQDILLLLDSTLYNSTGYFLVALGLLVSIRFTGFPDLTVDGSFTIGAALFAMSVKADVPVALCFVLAVVGGGVAGAMTATANDVLKIGKIVSSVLVSIALITVAPYLVGGASVGLLREDHWLDALQRTDIEWTRALLPGSSFSLHLGFILVFLGLCALIGLGVWWFFVRRHGIQIRYMGSAAAPNLLTRSRRRVLLFVGLMLGNGLVGLGGAIEAQRNGGFNIGMGIGTILIGLAILVLGESVVKTRVRRDNLHVREYVLAVALGMVGYAFGLQLLLLLGLTFLDVRLTTTLLLLVLLAIAARKHPNSARFF